MIGDPDMSERQTSSVDFKAAVPPSMPDIIAENPLDYRFLKDSLAKIAASGVPVPKLVLRDNPRYPGC
jgi:hypothetical protein